MTNETPTLGPDAELRQRQDAERAQAYSDALARRSSKQVASLVDAPEVTSVNTPAPEVTPVKKAVAKKAVAKKAVTKKAVAKKAVTKKATPKKATPKKAVAKKAVTKKAVTKKATPKK